MKKTIFTGAVFGILMLLFVLHRYYSYVQEDYWREEQAAVQHVLAQSDMVAADKVERFVWDDEYWIVHGRSDQGDPLIAWVGERGVHVERAHDGYSRDQLARSIEHQQGADLLRLIPGVWGDQYVWEAFYRKDEPAGRRYYYAFYSFATGQLFEAFPLPMR